MLDSLFSPLIEALWPEVGSPVLSGIGQVLRTASSGRTVILLWVLTASVLVAYFRLGLSVPIDRLWIYFLLLLFPTISGIVSAVWLEARVSSRDRDSSDRPA